MEAELDTGFKEVVGQEAAKLSPRNSLRLNLLILLHHTSVSF